MRHKTQRLEWRIRGDTVWQVPVHEFSDFHVYLIVMEGFRVS